MTKNVENFLVVSGYWEVVFVINPIPSAYIYYQSAWITANHQGEMKMRIIVKKVKPAQRNEYKKHPKITALLAAALALLIARYAVGKGTFQSGSGINAPELPAEFATDAGGKGTALSSISDDEETPPTTTTTTLPRSGGTTTAPLNSGDSLTVDDELDDLLLDVEEIDSGVSASYNGKLDVPSNVRLDRLDFGSDFVKPLKKARITSRFDYRVNPVTGRYVFHTGMDLGAAQGSDIMAMKAGKVISAKYNGGYGKVVIIEHSDGIRTLYAHCSKLLVKAGEKVRKGQVIALVGSTGNSTGPHLHIEFRKGGKKYDPEWVLGGIYS